MRIYFSGHRTFGNRGCEAIVKSTVAAIRQSHGDCTFLVPSDDIELDARQWPNAGSMGVEFVPAYMPRIARYWVHSQRLPLPALKRAGWPFPFPKWLKEQISSADIVMAVGGDNYSLDYRIPSHLQGIDSLAMDLNRPVFLWGASVGPFEKEPNYVPVIRKHLSRMNRVFVRESLSYEYLTEGLSLANVELMVDPAFTLGPELVDVASFWPEQNDDNVIGLNVSPVVERYNTGGGYILEQVTRFVREVVTTRGYSVVLVPHVTPHSQVEKNNDYTYMLQIIQECADLRKKVTIVPPNYNSTQLKHVLGQFRFFFGARTHATIAALSSFVPTISISYSVKALGINRDIFDHEEAVLSASELAASKLIEKLDYLEDNEALLRETLRGLMPSFRERILQSATRLWTET